MANCKASLISVMAGGAAMLALVLPVANAAEPTGLGVMASRHKTLHFNINGCGNLYTDETGRTATMGVLNPDGTPRADNAGNCLPYRLPASFALVITSMKFLTQEDPESTSPCLAGFLKISTPGAQFPAVVYKGGGIATRLGDFCTHEIDFGSGLVLFSPASELQIEAVDRPLINAGLYGYLVRN